MRKTVKHILIISIMIFFSSSCRIVVFSFCDSNCAIFRSEVDEIVIHNIPDGYNKDGIRIYKGHGRGLIIPYSDSSFLYIFDDIDDCPNRNNIEQLHSISSIWRNNLKLLSALRNQSFSDELRQKKYNGFDFTYSELFEYVIPSFLDLRGIYEKQIWRDVMVDNYCIGYIVYDSSDVHAFDKCIETTLQQFH